MNTLVIVLSAVLGQAEGRPSALWQQSYTQAENMAAQIKTPVAVFLTQGENGIDKLIQGGLNERAREVLASSYIPVIVDTTTPAGQRLAQAFEIPDGQGLVLSDRGGAYQAFSRPGSLTSEELVRNLEKYSNQMDMPMTEGAGRSSLYPDQGNQGRLRGRRGNVYTSVPAENQRRMRLFQGRRTAS